MKTNKTVDLNVSEVRRALSTIMDKVGHSKKDDCFVAKRTFFYTHGMTADKLANAIKGQFPNVIVEVLGARECWKRWPAESYFEVRFRLSDPAAAPVDEVVALRDAD